MTLVEFVGGDVDFQGKFLRVWCCCFVLWVYANWVLE